MSSKSEYVVYGTFDYADDVEQAIIELQEQGNGDKIRLHTPVPNHELEDQLYKGRSRSPVRMFTLMGGLTGCLGAFLMTSWMSLDYPVRVSAKPLLSYPAFVVIAFECTILLGAIFTLLSMFHFSRIPNLVTTPGYNPKYSEGKFGVAVRVDKEQVDKMKGDLEKWGAEEIGDTYVR